MTQARSPASSATNERLAMQRGENAGLRCVALLIGQLEVGGTEKQLCLLARELRLRGVEVHVLVLSRGGPYEQTLREAGVEVHLLGFGREPSGPSMLKRNLTAFVRLVGLLRDLRPDVLHAFLHEGHMIGAVAARLARFPLVLVAGRRGLRDFEQGRGWVLALERVVTRVTDHVVANAVAVAEEARVVEGVPARKVSVIYNGLPASAFHEAEPECVDTSWPVVVCVANLRSVKGLQFLVDAAGMLLRRGRPCTVVLVGEGAERGRLEAQASALGVDVRFVGAHAETAGFLACADVVVLPSLSEGLSNAVMEAMAAGRPVVATSVGGTPELLEGRGVLVPAADPVALAEGIARLVDDPDLAASLGAAARAWAGKNLNLDVMVDEHVHLYHRLLETRRAG
ncbi:glycosyltransferase [Nonomuraea sp. NPDC005983]|uniref:glycosyltransferase n=1 Tax=Nonomuraea sp. NPDC005983 TaxID=3155595 RepID=UPI0033BC5A36